MTTLREQTADYSQDEDRPLCGYLLTLAGYGGLVAALAGLGKATGRKVPTPSLGDIVIMTIATHRLSRTIAKDPVTSPLRAPFTRYEGVAGPAELKEGVRGSGVRKAVGELISCPFCISQWVATGFTFGLVVAPRATRWTASVFASLALADFLQFGYAWAEQRAEG